MNKGTFTIACLFFAVVLHAQQNMNYEAIRLNEEQPVIYQDMFKYAGVEDEGVNINGPSVIRIPEWIAPEDRAHPEARYYMYFAHHSGPYIRMAWAKEIEGPWHLYNTGMDVLPGYRGVLDFGAQNLYLDNGITIELNHLASPDAHVDHENKKIILYFHAGSSTWVNGKEVNKQLTYVSTSPDGLNFYYGIEPVILGPSYFRVFRYINDLFALTNDGTPYRAPDGNDPWRAPVGWNYSNMLWVKHPKNPFQLDINNDGYTKDQLRVRHTAVRFVGDELHVFYSRRGELQERIQLSTIDLSVGDWEAWDTTYPPVEILKPEPGWEGGELPLKASEKGSAPEDVNQLRDPFVFEDEDESLYLFYTGRGEDAIGLAAMYYNASYPTGEDFTDYDSAIFIGSNDEEPWISESEGAGSPPGQRLENLFDNDNFSIYTVRAEKSWIEIYPGYYTKPTGYTLTLVTEYLERDPKIWEFSGYNDSSEEWTSLHVYVNFPIRKKKYEKMSWLIDSDQKFSKYKLEIQSINDDSLGLMQ